MKLSTFTFIALFLSLCLISMVNSSQINSLNSNNEIIKRNDSSRKGCGGGRTANKPGGGRK
ncbi:9502_t:CDS:2 [Rhizophagus irregularis]|nr:9502_t:CDS:2 [Rhizophagus irregularis]